MNGSAVKRLPMRISMQMLLAALLLGCVVVSAQAQNTASPRFAVSFPKQQSSEAIDGRLLLLLSTDPSAEPRMQIDDTARSQMVFGMDVDGVLPDHPMTVDASAFGYPISSLRERSARRIHRAGSVESLRDVSSFGRNDGEAAARSR